MAATYRDWAGVGLNLLFLPGMMTFELAHYAVFREWYALSVGELKSQIFEPVRSEKQRSANTDESDGGTE